MKTIPIIVDFDLVYVDFPQLTSFGERVYLDPPKKPPFIIGNDPTDLPDWLGIDIIGPYGWYIAIFLGLIFFWKLTSEVNNLNPIDARFKRLMISDTNGIPHYYFAMYDLNDIQAFKLRVLYRFSPNVIIRTVPIDSVVRTVLIFTDSKDVLINHPASGSRLEFIFSARPFMVNRNVDAQIGMGMGMGMGIGYIEVLFPTPEPWEYWYVIETTFWFSITSMNVWNSATSGRIIIIKGRVQDL